jgi:hypothetical protein
VFNNVQCVTSLRSFLRQLRASSHQDKASSTFLPHIAMTVTIMATKLAKAAHTADIFAADSLDGPEIGTLVAVIDRARNLPNRKTMGKQDPYTALRLGKEAKKTETDRRGGQTPKWDQELRFTVREAPDYYKLKCSVFNDDKKTDLIGESWLDLKEVVVPGGGQSDLWHQLQFKGKYAGEIRMELTYYDTRPKDETVLEKRREKTRHTSQSTAGSEAGGPRHLGPREIKRRPLPPSPAGSSPSQNPLKAPPAPAQQPSETYEQAMMPRRQVSQTHYDNDRSYYSNSQYRQPQQYPDESTQGIHQEPPRDYTYDDLQPYEEAAPMHEDFHSSPSCYPSLDDPPSHSQYAPQPLRQRWDDDQRPMAYTTTPPSQQWSSPSSIPPTVQPTDPRTTPTFNRYSTSPIKNVPFRDSPLRQSISHHDEVDESGQYPTENEELPPPPPPAHRQGSAAVSPVTYGTPNGGRPSIPTSPLDARSPLQTIERNYEAYKSSPTTHQAQHPGQQLLRYQPNPLSEDQFRHSTGSYAPSGDRDANPPPRSGSYDALDRYDGPPSNPEDSRRHSNVLQRMPGPYEQDFHHPPPRSSTFDERHVYASSSPIFRPRAVSPNAPRHQIPRRSISPSISAGGRESLNDVPFSPDSYEAINPVRSTPTTTQPQSPAEITAQEKEEARQKEVERLRELGPIIGNDGREIDPTDHLPSDTWAPEPERKIRKPEMVIRFKTKEDIRRTPVSSPASARPQSYAGHASSPVSIQADSPSSRTGRNRLQKQAPNRPLPVQPYQHANSSPAVPQQLTPTRTLPTQPFQHPNSSPSMPMTQHHQTYATPPRVDPHRPALSEYSVHSNMVHSSPPHQSPYDNITLPPVPAKIPLYAQDDYGGYPRSGHYDSLSAELSSIDIGPSRASRTGLRSSRGYGY